MESDKLTQPIAAQTAATSFYSASSSAAAKKDPKAVAGQFEAIFYRTIFKAIRDAQL